MPSAINITLRKSCRKRHIKEIGKREENKMQKMKVCQWCGAEFEQTAKRQVYCNKKCANAATNERRKQSIERGYKRNRVRTEMQKIRPSRAFEKEAELRKAGSSYAEWQKQQTLKMLADH